VKGWKVFIVIRVRSSVIMEKMAKICVRGGRSEIRMDAGHILVHLS